MKSDIIILHGRKLILDYYPDDRYLAINFQDPITWEIYQIDETCVMPPCDNVSEFVQGMVSEFDRVCDSAGCPLYWWFLYGGYQIVNDDHGLRVCNFDSFEDRIYLRLIWDRMIKSETTEVFGEEKNEVLGHVPDVPVDRFRVFRLGYDVPYNYIAVPDYTDAV